MSSRASTQERVEFVRRMQQLYPAFDVTDACKYIMSKAATWVRCQETIEQGGARARADRPLAHNERQLAQQRISGRVRAEFPLHPVIIFSPMVSDRYLIFLRDDERRCVPVPTSKRRHAMTRNLIEEIRSQLNDSACDVDETTPPADAMSSCLRLVESIAPFVEADSTVLVAAFVEDDCGIELVFHSLGAERRMTLRIGQAGGIRNVHRIDEHCQTVPYDQWIEATSPRELGEWVVRTEQDGDG